MIIQVLQLIDSQGQKTGHWQLTSRLSEKSNPQGMCNHLHNSYVEAWNCVDAWKEAIKFRGDSL
ncbi:hypothetical protein PQG02_06975 [Nostoc sp. UHCC 0926]|uniref:hypothetical protein n=1 Tax=unclassified Nostoc TaxID=2593658 RepID=UPI0023607386|nr:hypothetical protein [Nostoc sp. UHCC 0926]WDD34084.1 hypothetical protein PQG02_06975 [Nostoc sp. UHCC 0926]